MLALVVGSGAGAAKGVIERTYAPAPPDAPYESVWAGIETTLTVREVADAGMALPLPAIVRFQDDDGHGATNVTTELRQVEPGVWQGRFVLPYAGRWEGRYQDAPPFALRARPVKHRWPAALPWAALAGTATLMAGAVLLPRSWRNKSGAARRPGQAGPIRRRGVGPKVAARPCADR